MTIFVWFWLAIAITIFLWMMLRRTAAHKEHALPDLGPRMLFQDEQPETVREVMEVNLATEHEGVRIFRGRLRESAASVYDKLKGSLSERTVPMVQEDPQSEAAIILMPKQVEEAELERPVRPWRHWLLFVLTILTTTFAGAAHQGVNLLEEPGRFTVGLPYSLGLLAILGVHELGHYFTARYHGMKVTPPYFIPAPFALGTFGAFIQMRSPAENRRQLFDVAVAGPLAGLAVAIPALIVGLNSSLVLSAGHQSGTALGGGGLFDGTSVGSSVLFALLSKISLGGAVDYGNTLQLSPLAFAGWLGLLVTALNLLPIGQLDGGHIARSMFGVRHGELISRIAMWSLFLLALFVWPGLMLWAIIVFFLAGRGTPPLNDLTTLTPGRRRLGYAAFGILAMILVPMPQGIWAAGFGCPYL
ncbi:MAG: site-2 protease family protein [Bryobacteraceae bacterium]